MAHVGVRTRARTLASSTATKRSCTNASKRRKLDNPELKISIKLTGTSAAGSANAATPRRRRRSRQVIISENPVSVSLTEEDRCSGDASSSEDAASASCCSSTIRSSEKIMRDKVSDLKEEEEEECETSVYDSCSRRRREPTASSEIHDQELSDDLDSRPKPTLEPNSARKSTAMEKMPSQVEIDEFFAKAEKSLQSQYADKYNFDFEKEKPLEGRFEWVRIKPQL